VSGRHAAPRSETEITQETERFDIPWALVVVVGILSFSAVLIAMALAGGSEAIGQVACASLLGALWILTRRSTKNPR